MEVAHRAQQVVEEGDEMFFLHGLN
jgi:hypothetical protein